MQKECLKEVCHSDTLENPYIDHKEFSDPLATLFLVKSLRSEKFKGAAAFLIFPHLGESARMDPSRILLFPIMNDFYKTALSFLPLAVIFGVMYFLSIRPQQQKMREHHDMLGRLKRGDQVTTASGLRGEIVDVRDQDVRLKIAEGVIVSLDKASVSRLNRDA